MYETQTTSKHKYASESIVQHGAPPQRSGFVGAHTVKLSLKRLNAVNVIKAITDADGYFEFPDLEAGTYGISATKKGYKSAKQTITLEEGEDREVEFVMKKTGKRVKEIIEDGL